MIAVAGATGTIGSVLVRELMDRGEDVRGLTRRPEAQDPVPGVEWVEADLQERDELPSVLDGCDRFFLLTGNTEDMVRLQKNGIDAAVEAGVDRVVKLSALGATDHSKSVIGVWHHAVEGHLRGSGLGWTILRPHHFAQNLLRPLVFDRSAGAVRSSTGDGAIPFIDTRDIAAVAATVLTESGHDSATYTLTGPEARTYAEATEVIAGVLDRNLEYRSETPDEAWRRRRAAGQPVWLAAAQLAIAGYQREGGPTARTTGTVEELLDRPATSLERFARDHEEDLREAA